MAWAPCSRLVALARTRFGFAPIAATFAVIALMADTEGLHASLPQTLLSVPQPKCGSRFVQGDFDADGVSDYACMYDLGGASTAIIMTPGTAIGPTEIGPGEEVWWEWDEFHATRCGDRFVAGDYNGDGKTDIACVYDNENQSGEIFVFTSTGSSFTGASWLVWGAPNFVPPRCGNRVVSGDFDGDGLSDLACMYDYPSPNESADIFVFRSDTTHFELQWWDHQDHPDFDPPRCGPRFLAGDFNGDGKTDLACMYEYDAPYDGEMDLFVFKADTSIPDSLHFDIDVWNNWDHPNFDPRRCDDRFVAGDFNGDDKSDIACMFDYGNESEEIFVFLSNTTGFVRDRWHQWSAGNFDPTSCSDRFVAGKLDDDDLDDLVCVYEYTGGMSRVITFLSTGAAFEVGAEWPPNSKGPAQTNATHCSGNVFIGRIPAPPPNSDSTWGGVTCGIDYGASGVGVRHHVLNPTLTPADFELPWRAVGAPLVPHVSRKLETCRAVETVLHDLPDTTYADIPYLRAALRGNRLELVGPAPDTVPFVLWIPPDVIPDTIINGKAHYDGTLSFDAAFDSLVATYPGQVRMVSFDEPYWFWKGWQNVDSISSGYQTPNTILIDAAWTIHEHGIDVWVNFSKPELDLMSDGVQLNSPVFDIISVDVYHDEAFWVVTDVAEWFNDYIKPSLDQLHNLRMVIPPSLVARQHEAVVPESFALQPWNPAEARNVNDLWYEYSEWVRAKNFGQSDPPVLFIAPFLWATYDLRYSGIAAVPQLFRYWSDFQSLPLCS